MSIHEEIQQTIRSIVTELDAEGVELMSPTLVANRTYEVYGDPAADIHIRYLSIEHSKQMARRILGAKYGFEAHESDAYQDDMFSGVLQDRYPTRKEDGQDSGYKKRELMTYDELMWVANGFFKRASAHQEHGNGIVAYAKSRSAA